MNARPVHCCFAAVLLLAACSDDPEPAAPEQPVVEQAPSPEDAAPVAPAAAEHAAPHWGYSGAEGPSHWAELAPEFETCATGHAQSPIDSHDPVPSQGAPLELHYADATLSLVNIGHTVQVNYPPGSWAKIGGKRYELLQFHVHGPSENTVDGQALAMETHLVHKAEDGSLAVIGVLMREGADSAPLHVVQDHLPADVGEVHTWDDVTFNVGDLLPKTAAYWHFSGSLTTPPCTEGVDWNVLQTPVEVSHAQVEAFSALLHGNARPVQPLQGRVIESIGG